MRVINLGNLHIPGIFLKLIAYFRKNRPDVFVSAFPHINTISMMAKIISGVKTKVILTEHNHFSLLAANARGICRRFFGLHILPYAMRILYPLADAIICVSHGVAESILDVVKVKNKITVIYNPVVSEEVIALSQKPVRHPWFLDQGAPIILSAGRLVTQKDYPTLLSAFALVVQELPARLVILGEGPEQKELEKIAHALGVHQHVAFLGLQKNPFNYMKMASVFVLSSLHEGFGNVIVEAMALGVPVISTDCKSGPSEIIENDKNGMLVPVRNSSALADTILKLLEDPPLRQRLSLAGMQRSRDFLAKASMKQYEKVFLKVLEK